MVFYLRIIKPFIYFNAMAYIAARKAANERKQKGASLDRSGLNATVDFPNQDTAGNDSKDLMVGVNEEEANHSADQGQVQGGLSELQEPLYLSENSASQP